MNSSKLFMNEKKKIGKRNENKVNFLFIYFFFSEIK